MGFLIFFCILGGVDYKQKYMAERKDYYGILGIAKEANEDEIKRAYRKLSMQWHPDRWATGTDEEKKTAEEKFKEISEAYDVLSDPQKRAQYDNPASDWQYMGGGFDPMDLFRRMHGGFGNDDGFFDGFPGFGRRQRQKKGEDISVAVTLTLKEAYDGCVKEIHIPKNKPCEHCHGTGFEDGKRHDCPHCGGKGMISQMQQLGPGSFSMSTSPCPYCYGTGKDGNAKVCTECGGTGFSREYTIDKVEIPRGVSNGMTLNMQGKGNPIDGGINGDLYISITVQEDPYFERPDERNIIHRETVPFTEALLGFKKKFKCVDGSEVTVDAHEITRDGEAFIFKGKGMPDIHNGGFGGAAYGDYAVIINHEYPKKLSREQKELLKKFGTDFAGEKK